ncbi:MAG: nuclear transport factor 2 family protein [Clostridia bacterium]
MREFFDAENTRSRDRYVTFLHQGVERELFSSGGPQVITCVRAYMARITAAYSGSSATFECVQMHISESGKRIASLPANNLGERSLDIFDF